VNAELAFRIANLAVLPWWGLWLAAPRSALARRAASHGAVFLVLACAYAALLALALASDAPGGLDSDGLRAALGTPLGFLAGWVHYLAFDLFVGAWILREALRLDVEPRAYLLLPLMVGPLGLGAFLLRRLARLRSLGQLGAPDLA
jgi:hypothetical protein